jgi:hypothetical protein
MKVLEMEKVSPNRAAEKRGMRGEDQLFVQDGKRRMDDSEVQVDQALAVGPHDLLDGIQLLQFLRTNLRPTVRDQGKMSVAGDAATAGPIGEMRLLFLIDGSEGQKI